MIIKYLGIIVLAGSLIGCGSSSSSTGDVADVETTQQKMQALGKKIFFDENLSSQANQSCASCHDPLTGFADPDVAVNAPVSMGSETGSFGNRNAPTSAYAFLTPAFSKTTTDTTLDGTTSNYRGGQFLDGRRSTLVEQAKDPLLNPAEMNNTDASQVVSKVSMSSYAGEFIALFGDGAFDNIDTAYTNIARAIAAFEASDEMNPFSSKFDNVMANTATFTASEQRGFDLFKGTKAKCANCHTLSDNGPILFTNHRYYNIGTPSNADNPAVISVSNYVDNGLSENDLIDAGDVAQEVGKFRVPTLRNIDKTAPYMHNGVYQTLEDVVAHYDQRMQFAIAEVDDINIALEVARDVDDNTLGLSPLESADLVNFMKTLSDE